MSEKTIALRADRFGKFYVREQKARAEGRNPQTGEKIRILAQKEKCVHDCIWLFQNVSYNILRPRVSVPTARWVVGDEWVYINNRRVGTEERCYVHRKAGFYFGGGTKATVDKGAVDMAKTKTFSVETQKDPDTLVKEARQVAKENDATLEGDSSSGRFSGKGVEGNYEIEGQTVEVTITEKPTLAPWSKVESKVREFFE